MKESTEAVGGFADCDGPVMRVSWVIGCQRLSLADEFWVWSQTVFVAT